MGVKGALELFMEGALEEVGFGRCLRGKMNVKKSYGQGFGNW